jgi:1-acyl-sn-glycerol-3-phosphate acyltransferase
MSDHRSHPNPLLRGLRLPPGVQRPTLFYRFMRRLCQLAGMEMFDQRVYNRHYEPADGGVVYISNHQSFLDPMLVSDTLRRPGNYMARDTLFANRWFRLLIGSLGAFPIRRGTADIAALKEAIRRLKQGRAVVIFPEGTRTPDGRIGPFLPGVSVLSQRAADWTVPVLIDGAFEAWPKDRALPGPGRIYVEYGRPISRQEASGQTPEDFAQRVRRTLIDMQTDLRRRLGRPALRYE